MKSNSAPNAINAHSVYNLIMSLTPEQIKANWDKFLAMCNHVGDDRKEAVLAMCDELGERLALAPASARSDRHNAFPGGLIDHSLRVLLNASAVAKSMSVQVPKKSIVLCSLFHDLGKVGVPDTDGDFYVPQTDSWRRTKLGEEYTYNNSIIRMPHAHRSLFILQHYGVCLTNEEFVAIMIHDGQYAAENKPYAVCEPMLALVISTADVFAMRQEKETAMTTKDASDAQR